KSGDLTKTPAAVGYFRTVLFTAHTVGLRLDGTIADSNRVNLVWGKEDVFDGDNDFFAEVGANFEKCVSGVSKAQIVAKDVPSIGTAGMTLQPWLGCGDSAVFRYTVEIADIPLCPSPDTFCFINSNEVREDPDTSWFNGWWWVIANADVGNPDVCFKLESGTCP
ncbi:MAG TPA: hypothetical protein VJB15_01985, partial [Rhodothermia bacterium]|nr:hypothetical protein [Rhodothermia bacterium]